MKHNRLPRLFLYTALLIFAFTSCKNKDENLRSTIDLSGEWHFELDPTNKGIGEKWFTKDLSDNIELPGTTDLGKKGSAYNDTTSTTLRLGREYHYAGAAWYSKIVEIPQEWNSKFIQLIMERTKPSMVWVDGQYAGKSSLLESPQLYDLSSLLTPGKHTLTICVNNDLKLTPYGNVHIYSDDTQTNWNGIIGSFCLESTSKTHIDNVQVFPEIQKKEFLVRIKIANPQKTCKLRTELVLTKRLGTVKVKLKPVEYKVDCDSVLNLKYNLEGNTHLWDEYRQPLYDLKVSIRNNDNQIDDSKEISFGMRTFEVKGTQFAINDRVTFLRGKNDACVFPMTGHVPMDVESWTRVMSIAKTYGINHYRFHSWCPPEAAFQAADKLGIYLQVELPFWGQLTSGPISESLKTEGLAVLKNFANHPSFVLFSMGNEIWGDLTEIQSIMNKLKETDGRPLYTQGSNDNIGYTGPVTGAEYQVAARTPSYKDDPMTHTRLAQAFADSKDGGLLNSWIPSTTLNFSNSVSQIQIPLISHEVGQYQIYPDFSEIDKYTGVLKANNLVIFRDNLEKSGMLDQNKDFQKASGALSAICYRAEIEAALRTKGMAGFQLLDLQDYPGQGTALVGILDAFMDSKGVISNEEWMHFNNDIVPMLLFDKYCWTNNEVFSATVRIANYSNKILNDKIIWNVSDGNSKLLASGTLSPKEIPNEGLSSPGVIHYSLASIKKPTRLNIKISIENTSYENSYPIWVYPVSVPAERPSGIMITTILNKLLLNNLEVGGKVLLMPENFSVYKNSVPGMFIPDFWNYGMFKQISQSAGMPVSPGTLGLLMDPEHPIFKSFPTDFHTNWQWWSIIKNSNSLILDGTDESYKPIVQVIDNMERNHKLGLIFEFKVGKGKLLVCMSHLTNNLDRPEVLQLFNSLISYMQSGDFKPSYEISEEHLKQLVQYTVTKRR